MTRKEYREKLETYFLTLEPKEIASICSLLCTDLNDFIHIDKLKENVAKGLIKRTSENMMNINQIVDWKKEQKTGIVFLDSVLLEQIDESKN